MTKEQQNRTRSFGKRSLSVILAVILVLSTFAVMLSVTSLNAGAAISYWQVAGNFNDWGNSLNNTAYRINGSSGSVTIPLTASSIKFKMVAYENGNHWCGNASGSTTVGTETELKWDNESPNEDIECALPANTVSVTFTLAVKSGKNYVTVTATTSGGGGGGGGGDTKFTAPVNTSNSANNGAIFWADATYYDYLSDAEINDGWLKPVHAGTSNFNGAIDEWYPFYLFNREIVKSVADSNSSWSKPLYFGNFCNTYNAYDTSHHPGVTNGYTDATSSYNVTRFDYAANNSNGVYDRYTSVQGLMGSTLKGTSRQLQTPNGTVAPYFDEDTLGDKARVVESKFPFRISEMGSYTRYEFDSTNAKDNVYFTWETSGGKTYPKYVNYGAGTTYGVKDGIKDFMNTESGYGIFPFNNASSNYKGTKTNANDNLNYGFGIRMDMKFRVPADTGVTFDFSGDDDLWMYITDETTGQSQLVLDMGGSHKESEGVVDFNEGTATVYKVDNRSASNKDIWIMDQSNWGNVVIYAWDDSGHNDWYYGDNSSNLYRFRDTVEGANTGKPLSEMTHFLFAKNTNYDGNSGDLNISDRAGKCSYTDNVSYTDTSHVESGHCEEKTTNFSFNTSHTYTMTIFYMERGLIESNCKMGFTMTPLGNNFIVTEKINTTNVNEGLREKVKALDSFHFVLSGVKGSTTKTQTFNLGNGALAQYSNYYDINSVVNAVQTKNSSSYLTYDTTWNYYDNENDKALLGSTNPSNPSTTDVTQPFINPSQDTYDFAEFQIDYVNTPQVGSVSLKKVVTNDDYQSGETFPVTIYMKLAENESYATYRLNTSAGYTTSGGKLDLVPNQTVTIDDVPKGARVYVVEDSDPNYTTSYTHTSGSPFIVGSSSGTITVTNTPLTPAEFFTDVAGTKEFDDENYDGDLFTFKLVGMAPLADGDVDTSDVTVTTSDCANGDFKFSNLSFDEPGTYRYHIYEDLDALADIDDEKGTTYYNDIYNDTGYLVTINVRKELDSTTGKYVLRASNPVFVKYSSDGTTGITLADFNKTPESSVKIRNFTQECYVDIEKTNQANQALPGVVFGVYKLTDADVITLNSKTDAEKYTWITSKYSQPHYTQITGDSGTARFSDLPMYQDGYESSSAPEYQQYCLIEYDYNGDSDYAINKTVNIFSFPVMDNNQQPQYHMTFSYVNGAIKAPEAGVFGIATIVYIGVAFVLVSLVLLAAYVLIMKKKGYNFIRFKK